MKKLIEKLWVEYFAEECAGIDTEEEKRLIKKVAEMQNAINELLTKEQNEHIQNHTEALYEMQGLFVKKAFFKGCEFALSFFLEISKGQ